MNTFITLPVRYLLGRPLRTTLTTLAVVFGVTVIFAVNLLLPTLVSALDANVAGVAGQADLTVSSTGGEVFSAAVLDTVSGTDGVAAATPLLRRQLLLPGGANQIELVGLDPESSQLVRRFAITAGHFLQNGDTDTAVLSQDAATLLGLGVGGQIQIPTPGGQRSLAIVGVADLTGVTEVLAPLPTVQEMFGAEGRINNVEVALVGGADRETVRAALQNAVSGAFNVGAPARTSDALTNLQLGLVIFNLFGLITLFMGGFLIFNTFRTVVIERRHDIGMLRAVGATRRTIVQLIVAESVIQGVVGTAIGLVLGYGLGALLSSLLQGLLTQYIKVRLPELQVTPGSVALAIVLGVGVTVVAGLLPARGASRVPVLSALRDIDQTSEGKRRPIGAIVAVVLSVLGFAGLFSGNASLATAGAILFLTALVLLAPLLLRPIARGIEPLTNRLFSTEGQIAEGNLARNPSRSAVTVSALMIALAILVGLGTLLTSQNRAYINNLNQTLGADILLLPPNLALWQTDVGVGSEFEGQFAAIPGVGDWAGLRYAAAQVDNTVVQVFGVDPVAYPKVSTLVFNEGGQEQFNALLDGRTAMINQMTATNLGLKVGDRMQMATPTGVQPYRVTAIGGDFLGLKFNTIYVSQANMSTDFNKNEDVLVQANLAPGADANTVRASVNSLLASYPQLTLYWGADWRQEQTAVFNQTYLALYIVLLALTIPSVMGLINTLAINVLERTREIGVLRAIGATRQQVRRMVIAEAVLLCTVGMVLGILGGLALGYGFTQMLANLSGSSVLFSFPFEWLLVAVVVSILIAIGASVIPARQASRVQITQALQYE